MICDCGASWSYSLTFCGMKIAADSNDLHPTYIIDNGLDARKTYLRGFVNNKGAYQAAHLHRLISAFVIRLLESIISKIVSEYDQEIPQSQTADNPVAPRGRAAQPSRDTRKTN